MCKHSPPTPSLPSAVSSHLCAKQVFPKTLWCQNTVPPWEVLRPVGTACTPNKGRFHPGYLSNNNYTRSSEAGQECSTIYCTHTHTHRNICSATPFMWKVFSGLQTAPTTMSRPVKPTPVEEVEGGKKIGPGECPNQGLLSSPLTFKRAGNETAVSKMTCNIPCQGIHQREVLKADTNS